MHTRLPFFAVIRALGDDRHSFLHGQLSNDIQNLPPQTACYATYNTPKGRVIANMLVYNGGDALYLALAADLAETVCKRLKMFVLRAKATFEILPDWGVAAELPENLSVRIPQEPALSFPAPAGCARLPHGGTMMLAPVSELPEWDTEAEQIWQRHEIACGYPWICAATSESCVAQMLNQHTIGAVHFRKGCYPGQEIIARAQYRGQVKRGLVCAANNAPQAAGAPVLADLEEAGLVINSSGSLSLLVVKHAAADGTLTDASGSAFVIEQRFF